MSNPVFVKWKKCSLLVTSIVLAMLAITSPIEALTVDEYLAAPISTEEVELEGQALVDHINAHQSFFRAKYSPDAEKNTRSRAMDVKYLVRANEDNILNSVLSDAELPKEFDARKHWPQCPSIGTIRDQSRCASCWAVAITSVMTDRLCIQSNGTKQVFLSDADLMACCTTCGNPDGTGGGCYGGYIAKGFNYLKESGVPSGGLYHDRSCCKPYPLYPCGSEKFFFEPCPDKFLTPKCRSRCQFKYGVEYEKDKLYAQTHYTVPNNETLIMKEIMTNGPVVAAFELYKDFSWYTDGVYVHKSADVSEMGHAVKLIGWGEENGVAYWLAANSYNTYWGEKGFFRILRGVNHIKIEEYIEAGTMKL
ncbi:unnamed protein product [Cylicocyclus nassatus]|uniref:Peptidase C1A papain C-terminal domain-containing protein n=1 Tax=Cylicocyclus nassatus TaxID=53992 RepID=A0AA36LZH6_CYLNA|nr:unnamed protein product [Cylicocyclus nassatus]